MSHNIWKSLILHGCASHLCFLSVWHKIMQMAQRRGQHKQNEMLHTSTYGYRTEYYQWVFLYGYFNNATTKREHSYAHCLSTSHQNYDGMNTTTRGTSPIYCYKLKYNAKYLIFGVKLAQ